MPTQLYLIELFGSKGAASALSANNVLRYSGGTFLPPAGPSLYGALDYGWGNTLLCFLRAAVYPTSRSLLQVPRAASREEGCRALSRLRIRRATNWLVPVNSGVKVCCSCL